MKAAENQALGPQGGAHAGVVLEAQLPPTYELKILFATVPTP